MSEEIYNEELEESSHWEEPDPHWEKHLENCDGCPSCNPTAFRDEY